MSNERGFTLLEVLIASAIAAAMFGVLLQSAVSGVETVRNAGAYEAAVALARSHLALLGRNVADEPTDSHGNDGPFDWHIRIVPQRAAYTGSGIVNWFRHKDEKQPTLYDVSLVVSWLAAGHRREVQIDTQRLGFALPAAPDPP
jgi:general secretion pathway protein I